MNLKVVVRDEINIFCNLYNQTLKNRNIVIAVSCGVDSTVLLHVLESLKDEFEYNIVIAHVNHGKREQSEIEEEYIRDYSKNNNVDLEVLKINSSEFSGSNFQEEARNLRLNFFMKVMKEYKSSFLFLAHHLNDDAETILMHLMRNSSLDGLVGMKGVTEYKGFFLIRPLLNVTKDDIYECANSNNYKYFEDYTNELDHYSRNVIRHKLISENYEDNLIEKVNSYKKQMNDAKNIINGIRNDYIKNNVNISNEISFDINSFNNLEYDIKIDVLFELLKRYALSKTNIEEINSIICKSEFGNKKLRYKDILILREYNIVYIKDYEESMDSTCNIIIDSVGKYDIDRTHFVIVDEINKDNFEIDILNKDIVCYNQRYSPFVIRNKMDGDKIRIKSGSKKVNDVLTDEKIPLSIRENIKVLADKDGNILSILGIKKSYILNECKDCDLLIKTNYYKNI